MCFEKRVCVLYCALVFTVSVLTSRLYNLSKPETNKSIPVLDGQYTGKIEVCERSGFVYDRNGYLISHDMTGKVALVNPAECKDAFRCAETLSRFSLVGKSSFFYEKIMKGVPFTVTLSATAENEPLPEISVFDLYAENTSLLPHFLGYNNSDGRGVSGLRLAYDDFLSGELHSKVIARFDTNAKRESLSSFEMDAQKYLSDDGVVTTIDKSLGQFVSTFSEKIPSGAVVVADTVTGDILAMSSYPAFDADKIGELLDSDKGELVNRAVMSFTPGSVFKMIVASAALESDEELLNLKYTCNGKIEIGNDTFRCHKHSGHGEIDMVTAFSESCNTYFINLGKIIGLESIAEMMRRMELNVPSTADFIKESNNFFVDEENDSEGYLANISFGQGNLCLSPLDMTKCTICCASGFLPSLSTISGEIKEGTFFENKKEKRKRILKEKTVEDMNHMMEKCVLEGTGASALAEGVKCGGKTATAQTGRFDEKGVEYVHKWFCGVYRGEKNALSICVLMDGVNDEKLSPTVIFSEICTFLKEKGF